MGRITNHNFLGLCSNLYCGQKYTHSFTKTMFGMKLLIPLCEKHYEEMYKYILDE